MTTGYWPKMAFSTFLKPKRVSGRPSSGCPNTSCCTCSSCRVPYVNRCSKVLRDLLADHFQFRPEGHKFVGKVFLCLGPKAGCIFPIVCLEGLSVLCGVLSGIGDAAHVFLYQDLNHFGMGKFAGSQHIGDVFALHPSQPLV